MGMVVVTACMLDVLVVAYQGETLSMYAWWLLALGLVIVMSGLLSRRRIL